jgi:four helix bundle protein
MGGFNRFEEIKAWQKAREIAKEIYNLTSDRRFSQDNALRDQLRRASISIMANIAEGFGRRSDKEFANFLNIAHASVYEVESHLYIALDLRYIDQGRFDEIYSALEETARMLYALEKHLR